MEEREFIACNDKLKSNSTMEHGISSTSFLPWSQEMVSSNTMNQVGGFPCNK